MVGRTLSHYRIVEQLGSGGMGAVYRARDESLSRDVALKVLREGSLADAGARRLFQKEALALGRVNHPNIETIYEFGREDGVDFLVTEYVPGTTLSDRIRAGPIPEAEIRQIAAQIAAALVEAHEQGVLHCDLKPANVILTPKGRIKVIDFGVARLVPRGEADSTETSTVGISGTLPYVAPERFRGAPATPQSDIYAFGAVLYEMAARKRAFEGDCAPKLMAAIFSQPPPSARETDPSLSEQFDRVILRCLQKDPAARYSSAWELLNDLASGDGAAPAPRRSSGPRALGIFAFIRRRLSVSLAATAVVTIAAALSWWLLPDRRALAFAPRDWVIVADLANNTGEPLFDGSLYDAFSISLAQSKHANVFPPSRMTAALGRMGKTPPVKIDEQIGREMCIRENIRGLITLSLAKVGRTYALTARLINPVTGDTVRSYLERAPDQDRILDAVAAIANRIRRDLGESLGAIQQTQRPLARVTTSSLPALKAYSDGKSLWHKGEYNASLRSYQEAVRLDPEFSSAHAALGMAYCSHIFNRRPDCRQHFEQALKNQARLTDRERMILDAERESELGVFEEATRLWTVYLEAYPDDVDSRYNLATGLMQNGRAEEAIRHFKEVLRAAPSHAPANINLATTYAGVPDYKQALLYYKQAFDLEPSWITSSNLNHEYGFVLFKAGEPAKAREVFGLAIAKPPMRSRGLRSLAMLDLYEGKWRAAEKGLIEAASLNRAARAFLSEARDRFHLAAIRRAQGDTPGEIAELDRAAAALDQSSGPQVWIAARIAIAYLRSGAIEKGALRLRKLVPQVEPENRDQAADLGRVQAELALARGRSAEALELLGASAPRPGQEPLQLASLAYAYERAGRIEDAIDAYKKLVSAKDKCMGWEPQHSLLDAQYRVAELEASHGAGADALRHLDALDAQFKDADPDLLLLRQSKRLRAALAR